MCKCVLPPGANPIAVDEYININIKYSMTTFWLGVQCGISEYICEHELYPGFFFIVGGFHGFFINFVVVSYGKF
jgi:hypothetical protein